MPRRKKKSQAYAWGDTPEIQALGAGFARQGYFMNGYGEAQGEANKFAIRSTAVVDGVKPQIAYLTQRLGQYGEAGGHFLSPITVPKVIKATGIANRYYLDKAFEAGRTGLGKEHGYDHSIVQGTKIAMPLIRAFRTPQQI